MIQQASLADKPLIIDLLSEAFEDNKSVNFVVKPDARRQERIRGLIEYSVNNCFEFGHVLTNEDQTAFLLAVESKPLSLKALWWDLKLALRVIGLSRVKKVMAREALIKKNHPSTPFLYVWFLGVAVGKRGKGVGSQFIRDVEAWNRGGLPMYFETSTLANLPLYKRFGFEIYKELDFGFPFYMFRKGVAPVE